MHPLLPLTALAITLPSCAGIVGANLVTSVQHAWALDDIAERLWSLECRVARTSVEGRAMASTTHGKRLEIDLSVARPADDGTHMPGLQNEITSTLLVPDAPGWEWLLAGSTKPATTLEIPEDLAYRGRFVGADGFRASFNNVADMSYHLVALFEDDQSEQYGAARRYVIHGYVTVSDGQLRDLSEIRILSNAQARAVVDPDA